MILPANDRAQVKLCGIALEVAVAGDRLVSSLPERRGPTCVLQLK